jgi:hypothetical protein
MLERAAGKSSHGKKDRGSRYAICARVKADNPELAAAMQQGACAAPFWGSTTWGLAGFYLGCKQPIGSRQRHQPAAPWDGFPSVPSGM